MTREEEEEKRSLNNQEEDPQINRGFELMLQPNKGRNRLKRPKTFQVKFGKIISLFNREVHFNFSLDLDVKKYK
jgi:hypothetical protein